MEFNNKVVDLTELNYRYEGNKCISGSEVQVIIIEWNVQIDYFCKFQFQMMVKSRVWLWNGNCG